MAKIGFSKAKYAKITVGTDENGNDTEQYGPVKVFAKQKMRQLIRSAAACICRYVFFCKDLPNILFCFVPCHHDLMTAA